MDTLYYRKLQAEAHMHASEEVRPASLELLAYEQMAFIALCRASETEAARRFIVSTSLTLSTQYSWVSQVEAESVRQLSLTIDAFRDEYYTRHQKAPSAQRIYRHVRMKVETDAPSPQDEQSVLLLEALMNGDVRSGVIPQLPKFLA